MRAWIVIGFLVVALGVAGSSRRNTEPRGKEERVAEVLAPASSAPRELEETPAPRSESTTPSLPLFEVGPEPEDEAAPPVKPAPAAAPAAEPRVTEMKLPVPTVTPAPLTEARIERIRSFLNAMLTHEMPELNQCYEEAQRRYPRLRRDFRLNLTLSGARRVPTTIEAVELDVTGYLPAPFDACVKRVVSDIILPTVPGRLTLSLPISVQPMPSDNMDDDDDDDTQEDA